ncbi:MAG: hypothetical protein AAF710_11210 [Planctomycetota bacterium]
MVQSELAPESAPVPRCVLLVGEAEAVPSSLVAALDRRGMDIRIVRQPPAVMLEMADHPPEYAPDHPPERRPANGNAADPTPCPDRSLVVVEPQHQPRAGELRRALAAYHPTVRVWAYHAHGPDGGASLEPFPAGPETPAEPAEPPRVKGANQRLRSLVVRVDAEPTPDPGTLISEDELAMLLGPPPDP